MSADRLFTLRRWIGRIFLITLPVLGLAAWRADRTPAAGTILPTLAQEPIQQPVERVPFEFEFRRTRYTIQPVATYELWGLVVSESNAGGLGDMYHDERSANTKDLCVVWGENATRGTYRRATFRSGSFTCYVTWPQGVKLRMDQVANNHLLTTSERLRRTVDALDVGDQVHLKGLLVDYQRAGWDGWRRTSTVRHDRLCEVILVQQLDVLAAGTRGWRILRRIALGVVVVAPVAWLALFVTQAGRGDPSVGRI